MYKEYEMIDFIPGDEVRYYSPYKFGILAIPAIMIGIVTSIIGGPSHLLWMFISLYGMIIPCWDDLTKYEYNSYDGVKNKIIIKRGKSYKEISAKSHLIKNVDYLVRHYKKEQIKNIKMIDEIKYLIEKK